MMDERESRLSERFVMIVKSGFIGALITTPLSYLTTLKIVYPLVFRLYSDQGYTADYYIMLYNDALRALNTHLPSPLNGLITEITTLSKGVLLYNLPLTFVKLIFVTLFVAIVFKWLCKILFYKPPVDHDDPNAVKRQ